MLKYLVFACLAAAVAAQQQQGDLDSVLLQIFGDPNKNKNQASTIVPPTSGTPKNPEDLSCKMENGSVGECVRYYLCNANNSVITDGVGIIDVRVQDGPCASYLDVCCAVPDKRLPDDPITPSPDIQPVREGCGQRNKDGIGFKTKGDINGEAKFGEFPWMVAILKVEPVNDNDPDGQKLNVYVGGGSLIHPSVVLTAAHYVSVAKALRVRAGEWDTQTTKEIYPYQDRDVTKVEVHKDFNKNNLFYDIALLILKSPMDMAPNVGVACLPPPKEPTEDGTRCFASGWGKDKFGKEGRYQVILKKVELPVVARRQCQIALRKTRLGHFFELHSSFMCAGGEPGIDTCKGDGGSPLVCPIQTEPDRYVQSGIVAWGIGCGENGTPGVYVDVSNLRAWIDDKVIGNGFDTKVVDPAQSTQQNVLVYLGGGSLIHPSVVLTAAHYVAKPEKYWTRAGEWDTQTTKEIYPYQDREVTKVILHKDFNKNNLFYDIALLITKSPFDLAPNVGVACLPPRRERASGGTRCFASGWGKDKFGKEGRYQVILKKVDVPVVERRDCQKALRQTRLGNFFELHTSFMCAGGEPGRDTCNGDGGSPLVCPIETEPDRYMQNGIVAWGIGCGQDGTPGVYVDVSNLRDWIDDKVVGNGFDPKVYTY